MIIWLLISGLIGVAVIVCSQLWAYQKKISNETARKSVHIGHALIITWWAFLTTYPIIAAVEIIALFLVLVARAFKLFQSLRMVRRISWGEFFFPLAIVLLALWQPSKWIFVAAVLHFGLADAAAALVGQKIKSKKYKLFGHQKSVAGTVAFWTTSVVIITWVVGFSPAYFDKSLLLPAALFIPILATVAENFSPYGSDNFTVPILVAVLLTPLLI